MNFSLVKKHPVATGAIVLVGGVILYAIYRSGSSTTSAADTGYAPTAIDPQVAAIQAGQAVQQQQQQTTVAVSQLQADVMNNQTIAALEVAKLGAERDVALATIGANADVTKAQIASDTTEFTIGTQAHAYEAAITASTQQEQIAADAAVQIADDRNAVVMQQLALDASIIDKAGQDKSRSSTGWTQIISALEGKGPEAIAANQPAAVGSSPAGILDGIANIGKALFGT